MRAPPTRLQSGHGGAGRRGGEQRLGKTTFARALAARGYAHLELDRVHHQAGWTPARPDDARAEITAFLDRHPRWVVDGNYATYRDAIWPRVHTVVWLDLPRTEVMRAILTRTLRRTLRREELWNGNREPLSNFLSVDPERSILAWAWTRHASTRQRYEQMIREPAWQHLSWIRVRSRRRAQTLLAGWPPATREPGR